MKQTVAGVLLVGALCVAGCKQADGPMPVPEGEQPNKIEDISRDLQNLASSDANAPTELADDLSSVDPLKRPPEQITALSKHLGSALDGRQLSDGDARKMANLLFVALAGRELSESQIEQAGEELRTTLMSVGAEAQVAEQVSTATQELANGITRNKKRWYHR
jgi:hypothetical protein